jgi:hypothetical protein
MDGWMGVEILRHEPEACWKCPLVHTHVALASIAAKGDPHKHIRSKLGGVLRGDGAASASTGQPPGCASEAIICQICWFVVPWATARTVASRANRDVEPEKPKGELVQMRIESKLWKIVVATCLQTPLIPVIYGPASAQNIFRLDRLCKVKKEPGRSNIQKKNSSYICLNDALNTVNKIKYTTYKLL